MDEPGRKVNAGPEARPGTDGLPDVMGIRTARKRLRKIMRQVAAPFPGRTVVVTHHCPHPGLISERREELAPAYGSNLLPIIERFQPEAWLFGHTHQRVEAEVGLTVVRNVLLGYPHEVRPGDEADILMRGLIEEVTP